MPKYIELNIDRTDRGPAWIARVAVPRSECPVYSRRKVLRRASRGGFGWNHYHLETGEEYWVSGVNEVIPDLETPNRSALVALERSDLLAMRRQTHEHLDERRQ
jgi:hypothetical protein